MTKEKCENCRFFKNEMHCQRYPPIRMEVKGLSTLYPVVEVRDWCGEWQPNEEQKKMEP